MAPPVEDPRHDDEPKHQVVPDTEKHDSSETPLRPEKKSEYG